MAMTPDALLALGRKFMEPGIFLTAAELDVFTLLAQKSMSARDVADTLKVTERGIMIVLDAVVSMGLLEKNDEQYHCPSEVALLLLKESPDSIMPMIIHNSG